MSMRIIKVRPHGAVVSSDELKVGTPIFIVLAFIMRNGEPSSAFEDVSECHKIAAMRYHDGWWFAHSNNTFTKQEVLSFIRSGHMGTGLPKGAYYNSCQDHNIDGMNGYNSHFVFTNKKDAERYVSDVKSGKYDSALSDIDKHDIFGEW